MTKARDYTKTESGIQLMKQLGGGRGATKKGLLKNLKKLFVKQKTVKSQESLTRAGKDLKLKKAGVLKVQKVAKPSKSATEVKANHDVFNRAVVGRNLRTHSGGIASELGAAKRYIKARGPLTPKGIEKLTGIPSATGRLLKQKKVLKNQKVNKSAKKEVSSDPMTQTMAYVRKMKGKK